MATFLVFKFHFNNKNVHSLKVPLVIEDRKQARKQPREVGVLRNFLENFFMLKLPEDFEKLLTTPELLHVDFNSLDGNEKNIFSLKAAAEISKYCKIKSNCEEYLQQM